MQHGKLVEHATTDEVFDHPQQQYTRDLLTSSPAASCSSASTEPAPVPSPSQGGPLPAGGGPPFRIPIRPYPSGRGVRRCRC